MAEFYETLHEELVKTSKIIKVSNKEKNDLKVTVTKLQEKLSEV